MKMSLRPRAPALQFAPMKVRSTGAVVLVPVAGQIEIDKYEQQDLDAAHAAAARAALRGTVPLSAPPTPNDTEEQDP